ncbi:LPS translocon maturation chaperone LptM [Collimonas humicola]|uniref:LPS translocon maturation chaperone LptM n=1 Tax=Collimonas humicola TaxID=2825886 RepID=UPI002E767110|nr:lipoprotein [Collimonas humicola]
MKPIFDLSRTTMMALIAIPLTLTACGQKGPLFMPAALPPPIVRTAPAQPNVTPKTTPAPDAPAPQETPDTPTAPAAK